jgi:hypothetical protein
MRTTPSRHVQQVAELVRRLNQDEIRELVRLVPQLQLEQEASQREELVQWAREQMAQHTGQARPMRDEDAFIGDMTVEAYFALPEPERERIWDELYATAIETAQEREVSPNAVVPAG